MCGEQKQVMNNTGEEDWVEKLKSQVGHQTPFPEPYRGRVGNIGGKREVAKWR